MRAGCHSPDQYQSLICKKIAYAEPVDRTDSILARAAEWHSAAPPYRFHAASTLRTLRRWRIMFRRSSLNRRLRTGPALLFAEDPGERLLDAVRRFDPRAEPGDGFVELSFCLLTGPIEVTPEMAAAARLPRHLPIAFLPEHLSRLDAIN